jgi:hypothetical protein
MTTEITPEYVQGLLDGIDALNTCAAGTYYDMMIVAAPAIAQAYLDVSKALLSTMDEMARYDTAEFLASPEGQSILSIAEMRKENTRLQQIIEQQMEALDEAGRRAKGYDHHMEACGLEDRKLKSIIEQQREALEKIKSPACDDGWGEARIIATEALTAAPQDANVSQVRPFPTLGDGESTMVTAEEARRINAHCHEMHEEIMRLRSVIEDNK